MKETLNRKSVVNLEPGMVFRGNVVINSLS